MSAAIGTSPRGAKGGTRLDEAKRQLVKVIGVLPKTARFNLIYFESGVRAFATTATRAGSTGSA